jgi:hypothetical protein
MGRKASNRSPAVALVGWALWAMGGVCLAAGPRAESDFELAPLSPTKAAERASDTATVEYPPESIPESPPKRVVLDGCLVRAHHHLMCTLERCHQERQNRQAKAAPVEPPPVYHHSEFHPVPVRPPLAPAWMGPGDVEKIRATRASWTPPPPSRIPTQQIQIAPPPMPEQTPRITPSAKPQDELFASNSQHSQETQATERSWIFAVPEIARREPVPIMARRLDQPMSATKR